MSKHDEFEAAGLLYDAALGKADWRDAGDRLAALVDGATLTFTGQYAPDTAIDLIDMRGVTPKEVELYANHYLADDLWRNAAVGRRIVDRVVLNSDLVSDLDWRHSRIYSELCQPNTDIFHGVMVTGTLPDGGIYSLGIHRPRRSKPFGHAAALRLERLLPHIGRALQVRSRLQVASSNAVASAAVLDNLAFGVIQVSAGGLVVNTNRAARRILDRNDGLCLTRHGLRAARATDDQRLQAAIRSALGAMGRTVEQDGAGGYLKIARSSGRPSYAVIVTPLGLDRIVLLHQHPAVMLIVTDPEAASRLDHRALASLFGFTPAEARVVSLLVAGMALPAIARQLGVSFETVRTHVARARAKTDTTSQVDLVRVVLLALSPAEGAKGQFDKAQ
jgi:DNA-binding CsgD family transcriptional regulator